MYEYLFFIYTVLQETIVRLLFDFTFSVFVASIYHFGTSNFSMCMFVAPKINQIISNLCDSP